MKMKNKFLFVAIVAAMIACLPGCKSPIQEVDVFALASEMAPGQFEATDVRSRTLVENSLMIVDEWIITDVEAKKIQHVKRVWGDGADSTSAVSEYIYAPVGLTENQLGMKYTLTGTNVNEVLDALYWGNGLVVNGDTVADAIQKIDNLNAIVETFPNHKWLHTESLDTVFNDTIVWDTVYVKNVKKYDENGKLIGTKKDTIVEKVAHYFTSKLPLSADTAIISFARNDKGMNEMMVICTNSSYKYTDIKRIADTETFVSPINNAEIVRTKSVTYTSDARPAVVEKTYKDNWYVYAITTKTRFGVRHKGVAEDEIVARFVPENMLLSTFDLTKGTLKIGETEYKLVVE